MTFDLPSLTKACSEIAQTAGEKIMAVYKGDIQVTNKKDDTPLTAADMAAHFHIVNALKSLTPDIPILSEEDADIDFKIRKQWQTYWLVDPLDGTREFIKQNGEFSVNIALVHNHISILGVIYIPVTDTLYYASENNGAYKEIAKCNGEKIACRKTDLSQVTVAGSRSHHSKRLKEFISNIGNANVIAMGSSIKSCMVADGSVDIYPRLGLTSEWDTAAAHCIVTEAGGMITKIDMSPLLYNTKSSLLNPEFFVFGDKTINWQKFL